MQIYDISPVISEKTAVFPGDQPFSRQVAMTFDKGDHLELSAIHTTLHIGAHADAPSHYHPDAPSIDRRDLEFYIGPCQVVHVTRVQDGRERRLSPADLNGLAFSAPRVLFATHSFLQPDQWQDDFVSFSPELIDHLAQSGVKLVGLDTPSVDPAASKHLESHHAIYRHDMAVLEGLVLTEVPDGVYTLVALPLKLKGADASPVRAVLIR